MKILKFLTNQSYGMRIFGCLLIPIGFFMSLLWHFWLGESIVILGLLLIGVNSPWEDKNKDKSDDN